MKKNTVPQKEFQAQNPSSIRGMFSAIAQKYDITNNFLSLGIHTLWKKKLVRLSHASPGNRILDGATGTGDLAFLFEDQLKPLSPEQIVACDFCQPMLDEAHLKAKKKQSLVKFELADLMSLPYGSGEFAIACVSFGLRNVENPEKALSELGRVVQTKGQVLILEFGQPQSFPFAQLYQGYSALLPLLGGWISGEPQAYQYLKTSSAQFPCGEAFLQMAQKTQAFDQMRFIPLQNGIAYLYLFTVA